MGMAERIKERRKAMGYTQTELGEKLGLQASAIAKYENGRVENIKRSIIADMARVLECSPCYLLDWEKEQSQEKNSSKIMQYYKQLNDIGKNAATEQVRLLTLDEKYTKNDNIIQLKEHSEEGMGNAAHRRTDLPESELTSEMLTEDEEIMKNF